MEEKNLQERTAETILQTPKVIRVGKRSYTVAPPSCATLIEISKIIPSVPLVDLYGDQIDEALAAAKDCRPVFEQLAILILGAKAIRDDRKSIFRKNRLRTLTDELMYEYSPKEANKLRGELLGMMEVQDFFVLTASLQEISLIQKTREAETIASGQ